MSRPATFTVRPVRSEDFDDLRENYYRLYEERVEDATIGITLFASRPTLEDEVAWFERSFRKVSEGDSVFVVADRDGHAVGNCVIERAGATSESEQAHVGELGILVRKELRGHGIGSALLERALADARSKFEVVYLSVFSTNDRARRLYERFGFSVCGRLPRAVKRGDRYFDEDQMALVFPRSPTPEGANR
jgi:RimJ/RimL family protein N-acetyltransferase